MITQIKYASVLTGDRYRPPHGQRIKELLKLKPYMNINEGTLFYGCYNHNDYISIINHKGDATVLWGGSDVTYARKVSLQFSSKIRHIVFTKYNHDELKSIGINSEIRNIMFLDPNLLNPSPLGNSVYCYVPWKKAKFYGIDIIRQVAKSFPETNFILARYSPMKKPFSNCTIHPLTNTQGLIKMYESSFCSIRPTNHDGFPQSIFELGMMGRSTGWSFDSEFSTKCNSVRDYINFIDDRMKNKKINLELREKIQKEIISSISKFLE